MPDNDLTNAAYPTGMILEAQLFVEEDTERMDQIVREQISRELRQRLGHVVQAEVVGEMGHLAQKQTLWRMMVQKLDAGRCSVLVLWSSSWPLSSEVYLGREIRRQLTAVFAREHNLLFLTMKPLSLPWKMLPNNSLFFANAQTKLEVPTRGYGTG
jgi:hypothetical protein